MQLRSYQNNLIHKLRVGFSNGRKRLICYGPTGMGKTELAMEMIRGATEKGLRTLFIANRIELINQASRRFSKSGIDHGVIQADHPLTNYSKQVQVCSIQTLNRRRLPECELIIIDEAHGATANMYQKILKTYNNVPVVGLTATPFSRGLGKKCHDLKNGLFEDIVKDVTTVDLINQGFLVDCKVFAPSKPDLEKIKIVRGDYDEKALGEAIDKATLIGDIVEQWKKLADGRKTIVFATNIAHSKHIVEAFNEAGIKAEHIDAYTNEDDRQDKLDKLRNGDIDVISNVSLLAEGFDLPDLGCMVLARPTKSLARYIQMVGRVLRPAEGKDHALILDHSGVVEELGFPTDDLPLWLDEGKPRQKQKAKPKEKLPSVCPSCAFVKPVKVHLCPICGFKPTPSHGTNTVNGNLEEKKREKYTMADKQKWYSMLIGYAKSKGYKSGWAYHKFKDKFGVYPSNTLDKTPLEPDEEVSKWIKHLIIKSAKSKKKPKTECPFCKSKDYRVSQGKGPHAGRADCNLCGRMWWLSKEVI